MAPAARAGREDTLEKGTKRCRSWAASRGGPTGASPRDPELLFGRKSRRNKGLRGHGAAPGVPSRPPARAAAPAAALPALPFTSSLSGRSIIQNETILNSAGMLSKAKMGGAAEEAARDTTRNQVCFTQRLQVQLQPTLPQTQHHKTLRTQSSRGTTSQPEMRDQPPHRRRLSTEHPYSHVFLLLAQDAAATAQRRGRAGLHGDLETEPQEHRQQEGSPEKRGFWCYF